MSADWQLAAVIAILALCVAVVARGAVRRMRGKGNTACGSCPLADQCLTKGDKHGKRSNGCNKGKKDCCCH